MAAGVAASVEARRRHVKLDKPGAASEVTSIGYGEMGTIGCRETTSKEWHGGGSGARRRKDMIGLGSGGTGMGWKGQPQAGWRSACGEQDGATHCRTMVSERRNHATVRKGGACCLGNGRCWRVALQVGHLDTSRPVSSRRRSLHETSPVSRGGMKSDVAGFGRRCSRASSSFCFVPVAE